MTYYVYALCDPRSNLPFYIGKGKWQNKRHLDTPWNKGKFGVVTQTPESNKSRSNSLKAYWAKKKQNEERN